MDDVRSDSVRSAVSPQPPSAGLALLLVLAVALAIAGFIVLAAAIGLRAPWSGFFFIFYFCGIEQMKKVVILPALIGALVGIGVSVLIPIVPALIGPAGVAIPIMLILALIYVQILQRCQLLVNNALWMFLTVGSIPLIGQAELFLDMALAVLAAAAYVIVLLLLVEWGSMRMRARIRLANSKVSS